MTTLRTFLFLAVGVGTLGGVASANAFFVNEHDAQVTGRAGASAASDTDASSIAFNPGGIAVGDGTQVMIGGALIAAGAKYTDTTGSATDTNSSPAIVPSVFATTRLSDMFAVGVGFHVPFGLAISWPDNSPQAGTTLKNDLRAYFITPAVGVNLDKFVPGLSVGAGLDLVPATVQLDQAVIFGSTVGHAQLGGTAFGFGGRAGVQYNPAWMKALKLGLTYKSQVNLDFTGNGDFDIVDPYRSQLPQDGAISTTIKLPMSFQGGVAYSPMKQLEIEVDAAWLNWSQFKDIDITLPDNTHQVRPQDYKDTITIRVGAEYKLPAQHMAFRVGYIYDQTPVPTSTISATLPDADRNDITAGLSYSMGNYDIHLAGLVVLPATTNTDTTLYMPIAKGQYEVSAFVAELSLATRFGAGAHSNAPASTASVAGR